MQQISSYKEKEWQDIITYETIGSNIPPEILLKDFNESFIKEIQSHFLSDDFIQQVLNGT